MSVLITSYRNDYSSVNVDTTTWRQITASLSDNVREVEIFDSSGKTMELGYGASGSEQRALIIPPGGNDRTACLLNKGMRIAIRAVSATATTGEIDINFHY